ncbi:hypothetical protein DL769_010582 [Monosporascus sp. CRB-8-3]|nr:hypothetical protein DL769_010582 [Monosporascus sp. CRB-8-3]
MSKRSFTELSVQDSESVSQILEHADELLRAAQALKYDLEAFRTNPGQGSNVLSVLKRHNQRIQATTRLLGQAEIESSDQETVPPQKARRLGNSHDIVPTLPAGLPVPLPATLTRWTPQDIPSGGLPPLPPVLDLVLEQAALTHSGKVARPTDMSYERLEWIGDAYLYLISSAFIFQTFPNLATGRSSQLREKLVKNETLSTYTTEYGLNMRARFPAEFDLQGRVGGSQASREKRKKVLGDIFEAYAAAAILGDPGGLPRVVTWLKALWAGSLSKEIRNEYKSQATGVPHAVENGDSNNAGNANQDLNPKVVLAKAIGGKDVKIIYEDLGEPKKAKDTGLPMYTVGVFLNGWGETHLQLGYGNGLSKKEAGAKAAQRALDNKKLIKKFETRRRDFQAALDAQNGQ